MFKTGSKVFVATLLTAFAFVGAQTPPPAAGGTPAPSVAIDAKAKAVLDRYIEVTGGRAAYEKLKTREVKASIEIVGQGVNGTLHSRQSSSGKVNMVIELTGFGQIVRGFDGTVGWTKSAMEGTRLVEGKELEQMKDEATGERAVLEPEKYYSKIEYGGEEQVNGKAAEKINFEGKSGKSSQYYDKESGLLVQVSMVAVSPQGEVPVVTSMEDYREVGGLKFSHLSIVKTGPATIKTTITELKVNPEFPADAFALPEDVQKLVEAKK